MVLTTVALTTVGRVWVLTTVALTTVALTTVVLTTVALTTVVLTTVGRVAGEGGDPPARAGPDRPLHPGPGRPLHRKLRVVVLRLREETAGRPRTDVVLLRHGPTGQSQQGGAMNSDALRGQ